MPLGPTKLPANVTARCSVSVFPEMLTADPLPSCPRRLSGPFRVRVSGSPVRARAWLTQRSRCRILLQVFQTLN
jgi:hypothetical protein